MFKKLLFSILMGISVGGCSLLTSKHRTPRPPAIVLVAFGTTRTDAQKTFDTIAKAYRKAFPKHDIRFAFTSKIIRKRLKKKGAPVYSIKEVLSQLKADGVTQAVFQSLHISPGQEFEALGQVRNTRGLKISIGAPLLAGKADIDAVAKIVTEDLPKDEVAVYVAHGNESNARFNQSIIRLGEQIHQVKPNGFVCSVEGNPPGISGLDAAHSLAAQSGRVTFVPLMLVSGVHIRDDVMGKEPEAWVNQVGARQTNVGKPLGERKEVVNLFIAHTNAAMKQLHTNGATLSTHTSTKKQKKSLSSFLFRKTKLLLQLSFFIVAGVLLANTLEILGVVKYLSFLTWPLTRPGRLHPATSPAFIMAFQSGAVANTILTTHRDTGVIDNRQLYTSVLIVSALSLFAHLPTYVLPIGSVLGPTATAVLFATRFAAIVLEVIFLLFTGAWLSRFFLRSNQTTETRLPAPPAKHPQTYSRDKLTKRLFAKRVWSRSKKTLIRLLIYVVPTFVIMGALEYAGVFTMLSKAAPHLFTMDFLPLEAAVIIPAQALSLYNGAIAAAGFVSSGDIHTKQAVVIILAGSIVTAPIRTLKHAMPTYIAILGARKGSALAITAQVLRSLFLVIATMGMWCLWEG